MEKLSEFSRSQPAKGGKNKTCSKQNGVWTNASGRPFYIKFPSDQKELFAELFAGQFIQTLIQCQIISKEEAVCFCTTDLVTDDQGKLGLIQPFKEKAKPLHQLIGTTQLCRSDRSSWLESMSGKHYYSKIKPALYANLVTILFYSTIMSDHSVHSGNVLTDKTHAYRIDFGAAWRDILDPNNSDPWMPAAYKCCLPKFFYQDYLHNYPVEILNQLPVYAEHVRINMAQKHLSWKDIINETLKQIPVTYRDQITNELPVEQLANALHSRTASLCGDEERPTMDHRSTSTSRASVGTNRESTMRDSSMSRRRSLGHSDLSRHSLFRAIESVDDSVKNNTGSKWTFNVAKPFIIFLSGIAYGAMYPFKMLCSVLFDMRNAASPSMGAATA